MTAEGDCFESGVRLLAKMRWSARESALTLCHGIVTGQGPIDGVKYAHCWVEETVVNGLFKIRMVHDHSNGRKIYLPADLYYRMGQIDPEAVVHYLPSEVLKRLERHAHYGPWDVECPAQHLIKDGP